MKIPKDTKNTKLNFIVIHNMKYFEYTIFKTEQKYQQQATLPVYP
jgi:hypothetical protein